jgi:hypothetical protein
MYWYDIDPTFKTYESFIQMSPYWQRVRREYAKSNLPKYCFVCDDPHYQLHHENYNVLGRELKKGILGRLYPDWFYIRQLIPICDLHHNMVHFDEDGEVIPKKEEFLKERRMQLRKEYLKSQLKPTTFLPAIMRLIYRIFH